MIIDCIFIDMFIFWMKPSDDGFKNVIMLDSSNDRYKDSRTDEHLEDGYEIYTILKFRHEDNIVIKFLVEDYAPIGDSVYVPNKLLEKGYAVSDIIVPKTWDRTHIIIGLDDLSIGAPFIIKVSDYGCIDTEPTVL